MSEGVGEGVGVGRAVGAGCRVAGSKIAGRVVSIVGARPQFVKAAVVSRALGAAGLRETLIHTGQHYDDNMSKVFFKEPDIPQPDVNLGIGSVGQAGGHRAGHAGNSSGERPGGYGAQTGQMLEALEGCLIERKRDSVVAYGHTNSTLTGALAAANLRDG